MNDPGPDKGKNFGTCVFCINKVVYLSINILQINVISQYDDKTFYTLLCKFGIKQIFEFHKEFHKKKIK